MRVRLAQDQDAESITALINVAFKAAEGFLMDRDRITLESVRSLLQTGEFLLAEDVLGASGGTLPGCVYVELRGERAYLGLLSVDLSLQKSGLGSALMNAAEEYCARAGCRFMDLQLINLREELPGFYRRRGYVETGVAPLTPGITPKFPCHFVRMSKTLA
jgi:GNAT superfamily N-acetyltransferase